MAYNLNNMLKIVQTGAMTRPQFRDMPTLDLAGAIDNYYNAKDAATQRVQAAEQAQKLGAYSEALQSGDQNAINQAWAAYDPAGYSQYLNQQQQREQDRQWQLEDMARKELFERNLAAIKHGYAMQTAAAKAANGGADSPFNSKNEFINLMAIKNNPNVWSGLPDDDKLRISARLNFLSNAPENSFEQAYQKAAGKKQGEFGGEQDIEKQKGYVYENGQKYATEGTVAADEYLAENSKKLAMNDETQRVAKTVLEDIDEVERIIKENPIQAAGWGSKVSFIPGTAARDIKARIVSIKGNAGVDSLLMIKKSGAGLGQIPQSQMDMLSSMMGNLDQAQSLPELKDVIARYKRIYQNVYDNAVSDNNNIKSKIKPVGGTQNKTTDYKNKYGLE